MNRSGGINEQEAGVRHCRMQDIQSYFPNNLSFFPPSFSLAVFIWDICSLVLFLNTYQHSFRGPVTAQQSQKALTSFMKLPIGICLGSPAPWLQQQCPGAVPCARTQGHPKERSWLGLFQHWGQAETPTPAGGGGCGSMQGWPRAGACGADFLLQVLPCPTSVPAAVVIWQGPGAILFALTFFLVPLNLFPPPFCSLPQSISWTQKGVDKQFRSPYSLIFLKTQFSQEKEKQGSRAVTEVNDLGLALQL